MLEVKRPRVARRRTRTHRKCNEKNGQDFLCVSHHFSQTFFPLGEDLFFFYLITPVMQRSDEQLGRLLRAALTGGTSIVLATVSEDGVPSTALNSWLVAKDEKTIALAMDRRSSAFINISAGRTGVAFELLADDLILAARGRATIIKERLATVPFPCALVHIQVESLRDHTVPGVHFRGPSYTFADDKEHRADIERAIFEELAKDVAG